MAKVVLSNDYSAFQAPTSSSTRYQMILTADQDNIVVTAYLPEKIGFSISSHYDTPFSQGFFPKVVTDISKAIGQGSLVNQGMTAQVWQGAGNIELSLSLIFYAETDSYIDVVKPITDLCRIAMPSKNSAGLLTPPGPSLDLGNTLTNAVNTTLETVAGVYASVTNTTAPTGTPAAPQIKNNISLRIGDFLFLPRVVVTNVQQSYDTRFDANGRPVYAEVDLTVQTYLTPTKEDLELMFIQPASAQGSAAQAIAADNSFAFDSSFADILQNIDSDSNSLNLTTLSNTVSSTVTQTLTSLLRP